MLLSQTIPQLGLFISFAILLDVIRCWLKGPTLFIAMIQARNKLLTSSSLNNSTYRFHSCLTAE